MLGFLLALLIGFLAYRRGSLSKSGVVGAIVIGTLVFSLGGWGWGVLLVAFFFSSSALSHFKERAKEALAEKFSKGHQRDLAQTLANGGLVAACALGSWLWPHPWWWAAGVGALATVNADTWATELGVLHRGHPRLITTGQPVEVGTSGGVSSTGVLAALAGAAFIGLLAAGFEWFQVNPASALRLFVAASLGGLLGSLFDSLLGATLQAIYFCDACGKDTERHPLHRCGTPTRRLRGLAWLDNDWVNFLSSVAGAAVVVAVVALGG